MDLTKQSETLLNLEDAWRTSLEKRKPINKEKRMLYYALLGHMAEHNAHAQSRGHAPEDALTFWDSKRPYGNKDIPASIAYTLGWGNEDLLQEELPSFVEDIAWKMHDGVRELIQKDYISLLPTEQTPQTITPTPSAKRHTFKEVFEWYENSPVAASATVYLLLVSLNS